LLCITNQRDVASNDTGSGSFGELRSRGALGGRRLTVGAGPAVGGCRESDVVSPATFAPLDPPSAVPGPEWPPSASSEPLIVTSFSAASAERCAAGSWRILVLFFPHRATIGGWRSSKSEISARSASVRRLAARFSRLTQAERLRAAGLVVLVIGVAGACLFYWVQSRAATLSADDLLPDFKRARAREVGILMGNFGVIMVDWADGLKRPGTQAFMMAAASALVAIGCYRVAGVLEYNSRIAALHDELAKRQQADRR
jgi:hypothetical protein